MDSETRHELKQNELAVALERLRNLDDDRIRYAIIALAILLFAVAGYRWWQWSSRASLEADWKQLTTINRDISQEIELVKIDGHIDALRSLASSGSTDAFRAYVRMSVAAALWDKLSKDSQNASKYLPQIRDELSQIVGKSTTPPGIDMAATFSLGTAMESLREFDQAKQYYEKVAKNPNAEGSAFKTFAQIRLASLDRLRTRVEFLPGNPPIPAPASAPAGPVGPIAPPPPPGAMSQPAASKPANGELSVETISITPDGASDEDEEVP